MIGRRKRLPHLFRAAPYPTRALWPLPPPQSRARPVHCVSLVLLLLVRSKSDRRRMRGGNRSENFRHTPSSVVRQDERARGDLGRIGAHSPRCVPGRRRAQREIEADGR